jgi:dihydrolipoamide dehydrogenase
MKLKTRFYLERIQNSCKNCKFIGEKTISLGNDENGQNISAEKILIASGTRARIPKIEGLNESGYINSEALRLRKQPKVLTIIGGGYIGCELAHFFGTLGTEINIIQSANVLVPSEDQEISQKFTEIFSKKYNVYLDYEAESISNKKNDHGGTNFHIVTKDSSEKSIEIDSDQVIVATGRIPNSDTRLRKDEG